MQLSQGHAPTLVERRCPLRLTHLAKPAPRTGSAPSSYAYLHVKQSDELLTHDNVQSITTVSAATCKKLNSGYSCTCVYTLPYRVVYKLHTLQGALRMCMHAVKFSSAVLHCLSSLPDDLQHWDSKGHCSNAVSLVLDLLLEAFFVSIYKLLQLSLQCLSKMLFTLLQQTVAQ